MSKKIKFILKSIFLITILGIFFSLITVKEKSTLELRKMKTNYVPEVLEKKQKDLKVLVIVFDPILKTQGNIRCSDYVGIPNDSKNIIYEVLDDLEYSSNGYIKVDMNYCSSAWIDTNEFPTYTSEIDVITGYDAYGNAKTSKSNRLNERTWLTIMQNGWYEGMIHPTIGEEGYKDWYKYVDQIPGGSFNYEYVIEKYDLINRRKRGEFDWVLLSVIEPGAGNETNMVGKNAYWINGRELNQYDCDFFPIVTLNPIRKDSALHNIGHMTEHIMNNVFANNKFSYDKDSIQINRSYEYYDLNLWERFTLNKWNCGTNANRNIWRRLHTFSTKCCRWI